MPLEKNIDKIHSSGKAILVSQFSLFTELFCICLVFLGLSVSCLLYAVANNDLNVFP